jgi:hypothetical protein
MGLHTAIHKLRARLTSDEDSSASASAWRPTGSDPRPSPPPSDSDVSATPPPNANASVEDDAEVFTGSSRDEGAPSLKPLPAPTWSARRRRDTREDDDERTDFPTRPRSSFPHDDSADDDTLDAQPSTLPPRIRRHKHAPHADPDDGGHDESPIPVHLSPLRRKATPNAPARLASHPRRSSSSHDDDMSDPPPSTQPLSTRPRKRAPYPDPDEGHCDESPPPPLRRKAASHTPADNESSDERASTPIEMFQSLGWANDSPLGKFWKSLLALIWGGPEKSGEQY